MAVGLAPRPANEEQRAKAVVKTGLIESPNPDLFQVYCDLAKDITGFTDATFSLYDGEMQCAIAMTGRETEEWKPGSKNLRTEHNICSFVLLDTEPLLMHDISKDPVWKSHPKAESWGYAGFPVVNKDNYALGTLCMFDRSGPRSLNEGQVQLVKKISSSIAHLLDVKTEQKQMTSQNMLEAITKFKKYNESLSIDDFECFVSLSAGLKQADSKIAVLAEAGLCELNASGDIKITAEGIELQREMRLEARLMKKVKITGDDASLMIDEMMKELN